MKRHNWLLKVTGESVRDQMQLFFSAALVVIVSAVAVAIRAEADGDLGGLLDAQWRGEYDLLVTATDMSYGGSSSTELLPPYAIATAPSRLSLDDLHKIRELQQVEVAAPIGEVVLRVQSESPRLLFSVPLEQDILEPHPIAARVSLQLSAATGLGMQVVESISYDVVIDASNGPSELCLTPGDQNLVGYPGDGAPLEVQTTDGSDFFCGVRVPVQYRESGTSESSPMFDTGLIVGDSILFGLPVLPTLTTRVLLVDPSAELELLGDETSFLAPLHGVTAQFGVDELVHANDAGTYGSYSETLADWVASVGWTAGSADVEGAPIQIIPIVAAYERRADAQLAVKVEQGFGSTQFDFSEGQTGQYLVWTVPHALQSGLDGSVAESGVFDVGGLLTASDPQSVVLPLPGFSVSTEAPDVPPMQNRVQEWAFVRQLTPVETASSWTLTSDGYLTLGPDELTPAASENWLSPSNEVGVLGSESVYAEVVARGRVVTSLEPSAPLLVTVGAAPPLLEDAAESTVPVVTTDSLKTTLVRDAAERPSSVEIASSLGGLGLASGRPDSFADIDSAQMLGIDYPVSSVRVRVRDVDDEFSVTNLARIDEAAEAIRQLGYTVTMVAGSSYSPFEFEVQDFATNSSVVGDPVIVGTLGVVRQHWPELGAASRVDRTVRAGNFAIAALAIGVSLVLFFAVCVSQIEVRRKSASVLQSIGWSPRRVLFALLWSDRFSTGLLVLNCAVFAVLLTRAQAGFAWGFDTGRIVLVFSPLLLGVLAILGRSYLATYKSADVIRQRPLGSRAFAPKHSIPLGRLTLGLLQARRKLSASSLVALCSSFGVATGGSLYTAISATGVLSGSSRLQEHAVSANVYPQILLAVLALASAMALSSLFGAARSKHLGEQNAILDLCGWSSSDRRLARVTELFPGVLVGVIAGALAVAVISGSWDSSVPYGLIAGAIGASVVLVPFVGSALKEISQ